MEEKRLLAFDEKDVDAAEQNDRSPSPLYSRAASSLDLHRGNLVDFGGPAATIAPPACSPEIAALVAKGLVSVAGALELHLSVFRKSLFGMPRIRIHSRNEFFFLF
ncbi:hypothetical protein PIB30_065985 [Stylosanthes scabra]|uniref:Uncharacterized protein n=1 Tax=Stylosanthes scabra TaxID=79078 RepID=A0ABU6ZKY6_9FABA|nr:hypothetical protein [Stylosanthes scabra]